MIARAPMQGGQAAGVGGCARVAGGDVGPGAVGHEVQVARADDDRARIQRREDLARGRRVRFVGDERAVARGGHDHAHRRALDLAAGARHALVEQRAPQLAALGIGAERAGEGHREAQSRGADGGDRPAAGRAHEVARIALLAGARHRLEADEGEVDERCGGDRHVDGHDENASCSSGWRLR
jgi:hypothetical protein